jgi:hypothetical protein
MRSCMPWVLQTMSIHAARHEQRQAVRTGLAQVHAQCSRSTSSAAWAV